MAEVCFGGFKFFFLLYVRHWAHNGIIMVYAVHIIGCYEYAIHARYQQNESSLNSIRFSFVFVLPSVQPP